ncbi:MAG TPA: dephospho-CoA kinase [Roseiarcus sp.]|nr:dephospho-CoA kinase [Roseiarcus sp.]
MIVIGLTGSIAMGKSTVSEMFRAEGVAVFGSDAAVHAIYRGPEAKEIEEAFPGVLVEGAVDRSSLSERVLGDPAALARLEAIVHPKVAAARDRFLQANAAAGRRAALVDIPLLFEAGVESSVDLILVVSAPESVQKARALARSGMTPARLEAILAKQVPDLEKRRRAHAIIDTRGALETTRAQAVSFLRSVSAMNGRSRNVHA